MLVAIDMQLMPVDSIGLWNLQSPNKVIKLFETDYLLLGIILPVTCIMLKVFVFLLREITLLGKFEGVIDSIRRSSKD